MRALIIDYSGRDEIKILNTRVTSSVSILSAYYMKLTGEDDPVEMTAAKLKQEKLTDIDAYIIPSRDFIVTQTFLFPPMPDRDIHKVLPREIAASTDSNEPVIYNFIKNGTVMDKGSEKLEVAAFFTDKKKTFQLLDRFKHEGIRAVKIIPEVQGLKTLLDLNPGLSGEKAGVVFLDLMQGRVNLNIFKHHYWGLDREFAFQFEPTEDFYDEDLSRISVELNRTFQYFKQRNRTYALDKVLLYGTNRGVDHLRQFVEDNHPVSALMVTPDHFRGKISYPSHLKETEEFTRIFTLPMAVAVSMTRKGVLNLLPEEFKEKEKLPRRLVGLTVSFIIIAAILIGATFWLEQVKGSYRGDRKQIDSTFQTLRRNSASIDKTRKDRAGYFRKRFFSEFPVRYAFGAANFVRRLSMVIAPEVELVKLEIKPQTQDFYFQLNGSIDAADNIGAQQKFLRFYQDIKYFDDMAEINFSTIKVNADPETRSASTDDAATTQAGKKVKLLFTIEGVVELD